MNAYVGLRLDYANTQGGGLHDFRIGTISKKKITFGSELVLMRNARSLKNMNQFIPPKIEFSTL